MLVREAIIVLLMLCPAVTCHCDAWAEPTARVDAGHLCEVQNRLRWQTPAWPMDECERVAAALNATKDPHTYGAIMVNESDMTKIRWAEVRPGVFDVGPMGIRCVTLGAVAEETGSSSANPKATKSTIPRGRCTNGPARGLTIAQLMDPVVAIHVAVEIVASKPTLGNYNARDPELAQKYEDKIAILASALAGFPVDSKKIKGKRMRELVGKIQRALSQS